MSNQERATVRLGILQVATFALAAGAVALSLVGMQTKSEPCAAGEPTPSKPSVDKPPDIVRERIVIRDRPAGESGEGGTGQPSVDAAVDEPPPEDLDEQVQQSLAEGEFMLEQAFEVSPAAGGMAGVRDRQIESALTHSFSNGGYVQGVECRATECRATAAFDDPDAARNGLRVLLEAPELHDMGFHVAPRGGNDWTEVAIYFHAGEEAREPSGS